MGTISEKSASFDSIVNDLLNYVDSLPSSQRWEDLTTSATGNTLVELISAFGSYLNFHAHMVRLENSFFYSRLYSSVINISNILGYSVNRKSSPIVKIKFNSKTTYFQDRVIPIGKVDAYPISLINSQTIVKGLNEVYCVLGTWNSFGYDSVSSDKFQRVFMPASDFVIDNELGDSEYADGLKKSFFSLKINDRFVPITKNLEDLAEPESVVDSESVSGKDYVAVLTHKDGVMLLFGDGVFGRKLNSGDRILVNYVESAGFVDLYQFTLNKFNIQDATIDSFETISYGYNEDDIRKIVNVAPGYRTSRRRMVTESDHVNVILAQGGFKSVSFGYNQWADTAPPDYTTLDGSGQDVVAGVLYPRGMVNCAYLFEDETVWTRSMKDDFTDELIKPYSVVGQKILLENPQPIYLSVKIAVIVGEGVDAVSLNESVRSIIKDMTLQLGQTFFIGDLVKSVNELDGVIRSYLIYPYEDKRLEYNQYLTLNRPGMDDGYDPISVIIDTNTSAVYGYSTSESGYVAGEPYYREFTPGVPVEYKEFYKGVLQGNTVVELAEPLVIKNKQVDAYLDIVGNLYFDESKDIVIRLISDAVGLPDDGDHDGVDDVEPYFFYIHIERGVLDGEIEVHKRLTMLVPDGTYTKIEVYADTDIDYFVDLTLYTGKKGVNDVAPLPVPDGIQVSQVYEDVSGVVGVRLTWNEVSYEGDVDAYVIDRSLTGLSWSTIAHLDFPCVTYSDFDGIVEDRTYLYRIRSVKVINGLEYASNWSNTVSIFVKSTVQNPPKPSNLRLIADVYSVALIWDLSLTAQEYEIEVSETSSSDFKLAGKSSLARYQVNNLKMNTVYYFRVRAKKVVESVTYLSEYSDVASIKTLVGILPPDVPVISGVVPEYTDAVVSWDAVEDADQYYIQKSVSGGSWQSAGSTSQTSYKLLSLNSGTDYLVRVSSAKFVGGISYISDYSDAFSFVTKEILVTSVPTGLSTVSGQTSIQFSWSIVPEADFYYYQYSLNGVHWVSESGLRSDTNSVVVSGLVANTRYYFRVCSVRVADDGVEFRSNFSDRITALTNTVGTPSIPFNFVGEALDTTSIRLSWDSVFNVDGYEYQCSLDVQSWGVPPVDVQGVSTDVLDLVEDTIYYFRIRSYRGSGSNRVYSAYSSTLAVKTKAPVVIPDVPSDFQATETGLDFVILSWS